MGYRDDFYVRGNIIGITGPVQELPSVYFKSKDGEYGHITQVHHYTFNWGRTDVTKDPGWQITNTCPRQCGCGSASSHEIDGKGRVFHVSRGVFRPLSELSAGDLDVVSEAIHRCPNQKTDPLNTPGRQAEEQRFAQEWNEAHARGPGGRRGAVDFTASGLANKVYGIAHPGRL